MRAPRAATPRTAAAPQLRRGVEAGPPDLILEPVEDFPVPAAGPDIYRCFVLPTNFARDAYLEAVDYAPGERGAVHHLIAYIDTTGRAPPARRRPPRGRATPRPPGPGSRPTN